MSSNKGTIDRFEGDFAVIELDDMTMLSVPKNQMKGHLLEGDKVNLSDDGFWAKNTKATKEAKKRIRKMMDDLFE